MLRRREFVATCGAAALGARGARAATAAEKTLRIAVSDWVPGLGNPYASTMNGAVHPFAAMFDALTILGDDGTVLPNLATSWEAISPTRWTFKLRDGAMFANGEAADAHAAVAMLAYLRQPDAQRYFLAAETKGIADATAPDAQTLIITTHAPDPLLPKRLTLLMLVPPAYWAKLGPDAFAQAPVGSGPFQLEGWGRDRGRYALTRNPASWRPASTPERIEYLVLPEASSRVQALVTGQVDVAFSISFEGREQLAASGYHTLIRTTPTVGALAFRSTKPGSPLADVRVRQALNAGVDRAAIAKVILNDTVQPPAQGVLPGTFGYAPAGTAIAYDPQKARALLADAGFGGGLKFVANVLGRSLVEGEAIFQKVAQDLLKIGVTVELRNITGADWVKMWVTGDWRNADMLSMVWNSASLLDASQAIEPFTCAKAGAFFCAPEIDTLVAESAVTLDAKQREQQLQKALTALSAQAPSLLLFPQIEMTAVSSRVKTPVYRGRYLDWTKIQLQG